jgi:hypothetical protein
MAITLVIASSHAWSTYSAPFTCTDGQGHGPDLDTRECAYAISWARQQRPVDARNAFLTVLLWAGAGLALYASAKTAGRAMRR